MVTAKDLRNFFVSFDCLLFKKLSTLRGAWLKSASQAQSSPVKAGQAFGGWVLAPFLDSFRLSCARAHPSFLPMAAAHPFCPAFDI
jgi:hypothetical protein